MLKIHDDTSKLNLIKSYFKDIIAKPPTNWGWSKNVDKHRWWKERLENPKSKGQSFSCIQLTYKHTHYVDETSFIVECHLYSINIQK